MLQSQKLSLLNIIKSLYQSPTLHQLSRRSSNKSVRSNTGGSNSMQSCAWVGSIHGSGRIKPGRIVSTNWEIFAGRVGSTYKHHKFSIYALSCNHKTTWQYNNLTVFWLLCLHPNLLNFNNHTTTRTIARMHITPRLIL